MVEHERTRKVRERQNTYATKIRRRRNQCAQGPFKQGQIGERQGWGQGRSPRFLDQGGGAAQVAALGQTRGAAGRWQRGGRPARGGFTQHAVSWTAGKPGGRGACVIVDGEAGFQGRGRGGPVGQRAQDLACPGAAWQVEVGAFGGAGRLPPASWKGRRGHEVRARRLQQEFVLAGGRLALRARGGIGVYGHTTHTRAALA